MGAFSGMVSELIFTGERNLKLRPSGSALLAHRWNMRSTRGVGGWALLPFLIIHYFPSCCVNKLKILCHWRWIPSLEQKKKSKTKIKTIKAQNKVRRNWKNPQLFTRWRLPSCLEIFMLSVWKRGIPSFSCGWRFEQMCCSAIVVWVKYFQAAGGGGWGPEGVGGWL